VSLLRAIEETNPSTVQSGLFDYVWSVSWSTDQYMVDAGILSAMRTTLDSFLSGPTLTRLVAGEG